MNPAAAEVAPGVFRISIPLPGPPHEVAAWLLRVGAGWTLVDTGMDTPAARSALLAAAGELRLAPADLGGVVLTHVHADHYGLAAAARAWSGAPLILHEREERLARRFVDRWPQDRALAGESFREAGVPPEQAERLLAASDAIHRLYRPVHPDVQLRGERGELPGAAGWEWRLTPGHSPGHVVLHRPADGVLIAGDHVLPRISPNIGADLYAANPLDEYLASLAALRDLPVTQVLPSHGAPFCGLAERIDAITAHHAARNAEILRFAAPPRTAYEVTRALFGELPPASLLHALREIQAHLAYLEGRGEVGQIGGDGVRRWRAA